MGRAAKIRAMEPAVKAGDAAAALDALERETERQRGVTIFRIGVVLAVLFGVLAAAAPFTAAPDGKGAGIVLAALAACLLVVGYAARRLGVRS